jgi:hypothetical protein
MLSEPLPGATTGRLRWAVVDPMIESTWNSTLPNSLNDGAAWEGRGLTTTATAGFRAEAGRVSLVLAPQFIYQQNRDFFVFPSGSPDRSDFASPWHSEAESADLPLRFGDQPMRFVVPGESRLELRLGQGRAQFGVGMSTESLWWGPGVRNALVMSNNAAGIPQLYARTIHPIATPIGRFEARWLVGGLTESNFFNSDPDDDQRSISAFVATLNVAADTGLTLGIARSVYAPVPWSRAVIGHLFDVFARWDQRSDSTKPAPRHPTDQVYSLFGRWVFPENGLEVYGEWAKLFPPSGFRELIVQPQRGQGFTVGLQWVRPLRDASVFRAQVEATMLEQTPLARAEPVQSFYTSRLVPQGYTQRGQSIGAAIGPGASSQWFAGDYLSRTHTVGAFVGRIRWEDEAFYRQLSAIGFFSHDVSIFAGIRGGVTAFGMDVTLEMQRTARLNYLFRTATSGYAPDATFDVPGTTLRLSLKPNWGQSGF